MQHPFDQHTVRGDHDATGHYTTQHGYTPSTELRGSNVTFLAGVFQIIFGIVEVIRAVIFFVEVPTPSLDFCLGILCGLFAISAGCVALLNKRSRPLIIAYLMLSVATTVLCGVSILIRIANYASTFVVISSLVVLCLGVVSTVGASFACGALTNTPKPDAVQVVRQYHQQPSAPPMADPPPPYAVVTAYPAITQFSCNSTLPTDNLDLK